jgi:broad specificity phosphatase PhoE
MTDTVFGLFRHGQTDWNIDLRLQGTADIAMNEVGRAQVQKAATRLAAERWDVLLSSPLGRARESAEIIAERLGVTEIIEQPLLTERAFGIGEGKAYEEWQRDFAKLDDIPGAESKASVRARSRQLLSLIEAEYGGAQVLAVSHGALIRLVLEEVSLGELPPAGERLQNASLHLLRHRERWSVDGWAPDPLG